MTETTPTTPGAHNAIIGEDFVASFTPTTSTRLDQERVKALLERLHQEGKISLDEYRMCFSDTTTITLRTTRRDAAKKIPFEMPQLTQITNTGLVDLIGEESEKESLAKKYRNLYREVLLSRLENERKESSS